MIAGSKPYIRNRPSLAGPGLRAKPPHLFILQNAKLSSHNHCVQYR
jgi:hypothetical protein